MATTARTLFIALLTATLLFVGPAAQAASSFTLNDATGDTTRHKGTPTAAQRAHTDLVQVKGWVSGSYLYVRWQTKNLRKDHRFPSFGINSSGQGYLSNPAGSRKFTLWDGTKYCYATPYAINWDTNRVTVRFSRNCFNTIFYYLTASVRYSNTSGTVVVSDKRAIASVGWDAR